MATTADALLDPPRQKQALVIVASSLGAVFEWYDFYLYGLLATIITALVVRLPAGEFFACVGRTARQTRIAIITVALIVGLAYLMNYSGMNYTLGKAVASLGVVFPLVSAFLGWVAVFLSGSDTSGNALFGNLQAVAANQLGPNPVLIAATNG